MERINDKIAEYWPCNTCYIFGYACAPLTLGTSLFCPNYCISKAEENLVRYLETINESPKNYDRRIIWSLHKSFFTSWIQINAPIQEHSPLNRPIS